MKCVDRVSENALQCYSKKNFSPSCLLPVYNTSACTEASIFVWDCAMAPLSSCNTGNAIPRQWYIITLETNRCMTYKAMSSSCDCDWFLQSVTTCAVVSSSLLPLTHECFNNMATWIKGTKRFGQHGKVFTLSSLPATGSNGAIPCFHCGPMQLQTNEKKSLLPQHLQQSITTRHLAPSLQTYNNRFKLFLFGCSFLSWLLPHNHDCFGRAAFGHNVNAWTEPVHASFPLQATSVAESATTFCHFKLISFLTNYQFFYKHAKFNDSYFTWGLLAKSLEIIVLWSPQAWWSSDRYKNINPTHAAHNYCTISFIYHCIKHTSLWCNQGHISICHHICWKLPLLLCVLSVCHIRWRVLSTLATVTPKLLPTCHSHIITGINQLWHKKTMWSISTLESAAAAATATTNWKWYILLFGMCKDVRLEVGWLSKFLATRVKRTDVGPVSCVNSDMSTEIEVQWETLSTTLKCTLHIYAQKSSNSSCHITSQHDMLSSPCTLHRKKSCHACRFNRVWHARHVFITGSISASAALTR